MLTKDDVIRLLTEKGPEHAILLLYDLVQQALGDNTLKEPAPLTTKDFEAFPKG